MGDVPIRPEPEPEPTPAERVNAAVEAIVPGVPVRRAILFLLIGLALGLNVPALGFVALLALALTDQLVER